MLRTISTTSSRIKRLAAGNLHHAGAERLHVAAVVGGLQIARFVARAPMVAVLAPAGARVGDFKGNDDWTVGEPVRRPSPDDPEGFRERYLTQVAMVTCGALFSKRGERPGTDSNRGRGDGRGGAAERVVAGLQGGLRGVLSSGRFRSRNWTRGGCARAWCNWSGATPSVRRGCGGGRGRPWREWRIFPAI